MKNRMNREFWTALGRAVLNLDSHESTLPFPPEMQQILGSPPVLPGRFISLRGEGLPDKRGRHIYQVTWNLLREEGFSRPFRHSSSDGVEVLMPFRRNQVVVSPQGFQPRIPEELRALALVGKNAFLRSAGFHMVVSAAVYSPEAWGLMEKGHCSLCTCDKLTELLTALDFSF